MQSKTILAICMALIAAAVAFPGCRAVTTGEQNPDRYAGFSPPLLQGQKEGQSPFEMRGSIDFGQSASGDFGSLSAWDGFQFDAFRGARVTLTIESGCIGCQPVAVLYGPRGPTGLWGSAIAVAEPVGDRQAASIGPQSLVDDGIYLILSGRLNPDGGGSYRVSLGCSGNCSEPACADTPCVAFCPAGFYRDGSGCEICRCLPETSIGAACIADADCPARETCRNGRCAAGCGCGGSYDPVCGSDGITYANRCELDCGRVALSHAGACTEGTEPPIGCDCPETWEPLCGSDGLTYGNRCELECVGITAASEGVCGSSNGPDCRPVCLDNRWIDGCSLRVLHPDPCAGCGLACLYDPSSGSGWYSTCTGSLLMPGPCYNEECECDALYDPVCGSDGRSYGNACRAACHGVAVVRSGECVGGDPNGADCRQAGCPAGFACMPVETACLSDRCRFVCEAVGPGNGQVCATDAECPPGTRCDPQASAWSGIGVCTPVDPAIGSECLVTGCNGEVCAPVPVSTDCAWRPEYTCLPMASCGLTAAGGCGWSDSGSFQECLERYGTYDGQIAGRECSVDAECAAGEFCLEGFCLATDCICPPIDEPVCGSDGITYDNLCSLTCAGVDRAYSGRCRPSTVSPALD